MNITQKAKMALIAGSTLAMVAAPGLVGADEGLPEIDDDQGGDAIDAQGLGLYYGNRIGLGTRSLQDTIASIIRVALSLLGIVAVVIILMGGFKWMTAGGNSDEVDKARQLILNGVIGLAIILSAFAISKFVIESLSTAVGAS